MRDAPLLLGLSSQFPRGTGLRILRRVGGALRSVIAAGAALASRRHRPAPQPDGSPRAQAHNPPTPRRQPTARRWRAASAVPPARPIRSGWLARWFGRQVPQPANRPPPPGRDESPFGPETCPGLSPEACAFFNTPLEDLDPATVRLALAAFVAQIADNLPPELGIDAKALFSTLCERLGATRQQAGLDARPAAAEDAVPAPDAAAPIARPEPAGAATIAPPVAPDAAPDALRLADSASRGHGGLLAGGRALPRRPCGIRRERPGGPRHPAVRRLCYAACAGPPGRSRAEPGALGSCGNGATAWRSRCPDSRRGDRISG